MGSPFSPKEKPLAVGLRRRGKLSHRDIADLAGSTTASGCRAGPQSWDRQRKRVTRPHASTIVADGGRGLPGK